MANATVKTLPCGGGLLSVQGSIRPCLLRFCRSTRNAHDLKEENVIGRLEAVAQFLAMNRETRLSPFLASRLAIDLHEATMLVGVSNPMLTVSVCGFAAEAFSRIGSLAEIPARLQQYAFSTKLDRCEGLSARQREGLKHFVTVGIDALRQAARLHAVVYGEEHEQSIRLCNQVEAAVRRANR